MVAQPQDRVQLYKFAPCAQCEAPAIRFGVAADAKLMWGRTGKIVAHLAFLFVCVTWGASFILMERATHVFGPVGVAIGRLAGGAAVVGVVWGGESGGGWGGWGGVSRIWGVGL